MERPAPYRICVSQDGPLCRTKTAGSYSGNIDRLGDVGQDGDEAGDVS